MDVDMTIVGVLMLAASLYLAFDIRIKRTFLSTVMLFMVSVEGLKMMFDQQHSAIWISAAVLLFMGRMIYRSSLIKIRQDRRAKAAEL